MTIHTRKLLEEACRCQWLDRDAEIQRLRLVLTQHPVAVHEIREIQDGMIHYYDDEDIKQIIAEVFQQLLMDARTEHTTRHERIDYETQLRNYAEVPIYDIHPIPRCKLRYRFVLHLYSGVKRPNDLHSKLLEMSEIEGVSLFPISLDIMLSKDHGDLLRPATQDYWAALALCGAIHFAFGGPPCETWSVSRWRRYESQQGPRPLRSGEERFVEIWGWHYLTIRELRQLVVSNSLLLYMIRIFICQLCAGAGALIEHPGKPGRREGQQPASIWVLPIIYILIQCRQVSLIPIAQGFWGAISPKPTDLLITTPHGTGKEYREWLEKYCVRDTLPPPLQMGRDGSIYNTAQLKRYPGPLCKAMAYLAAQCAKQMHHLEEMKGTAQGRMDSAHHVALQLRAAYDESLMNDADGHDYHRYNAT